MGKPKLKTKDRGFKKFMERGKALASKPHTKVGVLGKTDTRAGDELGNVELAVILHFGDSRNHVPARPFLTQALQTHEPEWQKLLKTIATKHVEGKLDLEKGLALLGEKAAGNVRSTITTGAGVPPPNAESTIRQKGSSRPLVDSGRLVQSISHEEVAGAEHGHKH